MRIWRWITRSRNARKTGEWDYDGDSLRRDLLSDANDGIISSAAIIQGLLSGGATNQEALIGVLAIIVIGTVTAYATQFNESYADRQNLLAIYDTERRRLEEDPEDEFNELIEIYEEKGLSHDLSTLVARELMAKDALTAQLDAEFDIDEIPSAFYPFRRAGYSAAAFITGSVLPLVFLLVVPRSSRGELTMVVVVAALAFSGYIGHFSDHTKWWQAVLRTVMVGLIVLGISTLAGSLVTF